MGETVPGHSRWGRRFRVGGGVLLVALLAHGAVWWWAARQIEAGLPGFVAEARSVGWEVSGGTTSWAGWPLAATVRVPGVVATRKLGAATLRVGFGRVDVELSSMDHTALHVSAVGEHRVELGEGPPVRLRAQSAMLRVLLDGTGPSTLSVRGLEAAGPRNEGVTLATLDGTIGEAVLAADVRGMQVRPPFTAPFDVGGDVTVRLLIRPPFPVAANPAASAAQWQQAGGVIEVPEMTVNWGPLMGGGHATGGLDAELQPTGRGEVVARGVLELLDAAARAGLLAPSAAQAVRAVLGILTLAAPATPLRLPLGLASGTVEVAQFPLARVPRIDWDAR